MLQKTHQRSKGFRIESSTLKNRYSQSNLSPPNLSKWLLSRNQVHMIQTTCVLNTMNKETDFLISPDEIVEI
jgi:hypothetical protein